MINSLFKSSTILGHPISPSNDDSCMGRLGLKTMLVFCSTRAWRGSPRWLLQAVALLLTIVFLFHLLPNRLASSDFATGYKNMLPWSDAVKPVPEGDLRIVVFGSPDAVGSAMDSAQRRTTWTEQLCKELNCSKHLSFVPKIGDGRALTSNSIYETQLKALQNITASVNVTEQPGLDYDYIGDHYPVPSDIPDLTAQVNEFLAMPAPKIPPRETLWIFTFGTWEVWKSASMPRASGEAIIDDSTTTIFQQIELLYTKALDPASVAFSDFWSNVTESQIDELTDPDAITKIDERKLESFRVMIPYLFDMGMTPAWQTRYTPPYPHSLSEQLRNAAELTARWNSEIQSQMDSWKKRGSQKPDLLKDEPEQIVEIEESSKLLKYIPSALRPSTDSDDEYADSNPRPSTRSDGEYADSDPIIYAPYPHRIVLHSNPASTILNAMTEEEMQRGGVSDTEGRGKVALNDTMRFLDVWTPCYKSTAKISAVDNSSAGEEIEECEIPHNHLFLDPFTIGHRAVVSVAKSVALEVRETLFMANDKRPGWFYKEKRGSEQSFVRKVRS